MNETIKRIVRHTNDLMVETRNVSSFAERVGLALWHAYGRDLEEIPAEESDGDASLREKAAQSQWHIGAALGLIKRMAMTPNSTGFGRWGQSQITKVGLAI